MKILYEPPVLLFSLRGTCPRTQGALSFGVPMTSTFPHCFASVPLSAVRTDWSCAQAVALLFLGFQRGCAALVSRSERELVTAILVVFLAVDYDRALTPESTVADRIPVPGARALTGARERLSLAFQAPVLVHVHLGPPEQGGRGAGLADVQVECWRVICDAAFAAGCHPVIASV
jgi:hypothetical protein